VKIVSYYLWTFFLGLLLLSAPIESYSQTDTNADFQEWVQLSVAKKFSNKFSASVTTHLRFTDNASSFNDIDFDWRLNYNFSKKFGANVIFRNWMFKNRAPVYFMWYELRYTEAGPKYKWNNLFRLHNGLDYSERVSADFLRWRSHYFHKMPESKFTPFLGYDLWYRFNDQNELQRLWVEVGTNYAIGKIKLTLMYRRFEFFEKLGGRDRNILVTALSYSF